MGKFTGLVEWQKLSPVMNFVTVSGLLVSDDRRQINLVKLANG
jgi:hypothetical protein